MHMEKKVEIIKDKNTIKITIYEKAVAQGRPRFNRYTGRAYDPVKSRSWKERIGTEVKQKINFKPFNLPLSLEVRIEMAPPKSLKKKDRETAIKEHLPIVVRPDLDNYIKCIQDAFNGILYVDDSLIYSLTGIKVYGEKDKIEVVLQGGDNGKDNST